MGHPRLYSAPEGWATRRSTGFRIGFLLLALAAVATVGLMLTTGWEQAQTPGEKNLGVAVLFMFWLPILFLAAGGVCFLLGSTVVLVYRRWKKPERHRSRLLLNRHITH